MAEAIVNARLGDRWDAFSAGSRPTGEVHPLALKTLAQIGITHQGRSKSIQEFIGQQFDLVVILCNDSDQDCPVWLGKGKVVHHPYPDPGRLAGTEQEKLQAFRGVRDSIDEQITHLLVTFAST